MQRKPDLDALHPSESRSGKLVNLSRKGEKLYLQVAAIYRHAILSGKLGSGERLPTIDEVSDQLGVSPIVVRQAMALLEGELLVKRVQGKGTFVSGEHHSRSSVLMSFEASWAGSFWNGARRRPKPIDSTRVDTPPQVVDVEAEPARSYQFLRRTHETDGRIYAYVEIHMDSDLYAKCPDRFETELVLEIIQEVAGEDLLYGRQTFRVDAAAPHEAGHLQIAAGAPVARVRRVLVDRRNVLVFVGDTTYRGDSIQFQSVWTPPKGNDGK